MKSSEPIKETVQTTQSPTPVEKETVVTTQAEVFPPPVAMLQVSTGWYFHKYAVSPICFDLRIKLEANCQVRTSICQ